MVEPRGVRANSWQDVADLSARAGVQLDGWQELILKAAMGERSDMSWAAKRVGISVPRQNGKSQLLVARALAGVLLFEERKIVISAHQQDTAREAFSKMVEILEADGNEWLLDRVKPGTSGIMSAYQREAVKFKNGATIQFKARTASGGRGFSSDCLLLDEAQRLKRPAWVSINSTMSAMPNPQVWLLGTPPTADDIEAGMGEVFGSVRDAARNGVSTAAAWVEWGADPESENFDPASEFTRWSANPAWNTRINHEIVQGEYESYTTQEFALDRLGIWLADTVAPPLISAATWERLEVEQAPEVGDVYYGIRFSPDGSTVAIGAALLSEGAPVHVEVVEHRDMSAGTNWIADWIVQRERTGALFVIDGRSHRDALVNTLVERGFRQKRLLLPSVDQVVTAHAMFLDAVLSDNKMTYFAGNTVLVDSVAAAKKRPIGKAGGWGWQPLGTGDVVPLEAVTLAHFGAVNATTKRKRTGESVFR